LAAEPAACPGVPPEKNEHSCRLQPPAQRGHLIYSARCPQPVEQRGYGVGVGVVEAGSGRPKYS